MAATLDGLVKETGAVFEAKFMLPWSFSEEAAAEKHMAQLQHNMLVAGTKKSVLSIINGGGKWVELSVEADPIYQTILIAAEKAFWRAVKTGETPALFDCEPPKPRIEAVRVVDMNASNSWAEFAALFCQTREAHADHERAKSELKGLMPEDAKEAMGHGIRAETVKIRRDQLRSGRDGGPPCIGPVKASPPSPPPWQKPRPNSPIPRKRW